VSLQLLSAGRYDVRDLVVGYYVSPALRGKLAAAAPDACILVDCATPTARYTRVGPGGIMSLKATVETAERLGRCRIRYVVAVGFSAGCQALRSLLLEGEQPDAIVAIDGIHSSSPPHAWQLDPWRAYADEARAERRVMLATHTQIEPPTFRSTGATVADVTGFPRQQQGRQRDGWLIVDAYQGRDAKAHQLQAQEVLPRAVGEALQVLAGQPADSQPDTVPSPPPEASSLRQRVVSVARSQIGVTEATGRNDGPQIQRYFAGCTRRSTDGGERPTGGDKSWPWCAAFSTWCLYEAADGEPMPVGRRIAVWELVRDAAEAGRLYAADSGYRPRPGDLVIERRDGGDPRVEGQPGHVGVAVSEVDDVERYRCVDGNSGNMVRAVDRSIHDADVVAYVALVDPTVEAAQYAVSLAVQSAEQVAQVYADAARWLGLEPADEMVG
jgi:hypothetical protein